MIRRALVVVGLVAVFAFRLHSSANAQVGPEGIDWVTVGAAGNRGYDRDDPFGRTTGRGSVNYEYKIGRFEVTTAQWVEFMNAASARLDPIPFITGFAEWGGAPDDNYHGPGQRFVVRPGKDMLPAGGVTWRQAAIYANWLCNDKSAERSAFLNGAYDVSTFGYTGPRQDIFTDQFAHNPGARYWIPTLDESLKAGYYDPNRLNDDGTRGGWWLYNNGRDTSPRYASPTAGGEANAGFIVTGERQFDISLGAYETTSPWGLYDTAGATSEWTEEVDQGPFPNTPIYRVAVGSAWATPNTAADLAYVQGSSAFPSELDYQFGLRLATSIPAPGGAFVILSLVLVGVPRDRRRLC